MRVITGTAKGKRLITLEGNDVRPTTDRVKEAVFSIIHFDLQGRTFLDLFAGSGQMGIEALSRGAKKAFFVDFNRKSIDVLKKNLDNTKLLENGSIFNGEAKSFLLNTSEKFDFAFLDPPYNKGILQEILPFVAPKMSKIGKIICESPQKETLPQEICDFVLDREYHYGKIKISTYCHKDMTD
ncbi:MAG: 16S rRNA (guanine(966)-N(2))-methyltransferase RsmD [Acutalibacteraceae bacterium]